MTEGQTAEDVRKVEERREEEEGEGSLLVSPCGPGGGPAADDSGETEGVSHDSGHSVASQLTISELENEVGCLQDCPSHPRLAMTFSLYSYSFQLRGFVLRFFCRNMQNQSYTVDMPSPIVWCKASVDHT